MAVSNYKEVLEYIESEEYTFIGIDGTTRVGKSTLARRLSKDLSASKQGGFKHPVKHWNA